MSGAGDERRVSVPACFMPRLGLGCWQSSTGEVGQAVEWAVLDAGVRMVDSAFAYGNEKEIGRALAKCVASGKVKREELFVVTKLPLFAMRPEDVPGMFQRSLDDLGLEYIDLYLVHSPLGCEKDEETNHIKFVDGKAKFNPDTDLLGIWKAMEELVDSGHCRAIGASNFNSEQLERVSAVARRPIAVNQVECNVSFQQKKLRSTMARLGVQLMAYAPLGSPNRPAHLHLPDPPHLLDDPHVVRISRKYARSPAQVLIRFLLQLGFIVIPKSVKENHILENFDVWDFALSEPELSELSSLDLGSRGGRTFNFDFLPTDDDVKEMKEYPFKGRDEY